MKKKIKTVLILVFLIALFVVLSIISAREEKPSINNKEPESGILLDESDAGIITTVHKNKPPKLPSEPDFKELFLERAEAMCAFDDVNMIEIYNRVGKPEEAIELCKKRNDYRCVYRIVYNYKEYLPDTEEYNLLAILNRLENSDKPPGYAWLGFRYEELGELEKAEEMYKMDVKNDMDYSLLAHFYIEYDWDESLLTLLSRDKDSIIFNYVAGHEGVLERLGLYDKYLYECRRETTSECLYKLNSEDITDEMIQDHWEFGIYFGDFSALVDVVIISQRLNMDKSGYYYDFLKEEIIDFVKNNEGGRLGFFGLTLHRVGMYKDVLPYLGKYSDDTIVDLALGNEDYETVYKILEDGDAMDVYRAAGWARGRDKNEKKAVELYTLFLTGNDNFESRWDDISYEAAIAYGALGHWDKAMDICSQLPSTEYKGACDCANEVMDDMYNHFGIHFFEEEY